MEKDRLTIVMDTSLVMRLKCNKLWMLVPPIIRNIIALSISTYTTYVHGSTSKYSQHGKHITSICI